MVQAHKWAGRLRRLCCFTFRCYILTLCMLQIHFRRQARVPGHFAEISVSGQCDAFPSRSLLLPRDFCKLCPGFVYSITCSCYSSDYSDSYSSFMSTSYLLSYHLIELPLLLMTWFSSPTKLKCGFASQSN